MVCDYSLINSASKLPDEWDENAEDCFQRREFLLYLEKYNRCAQRYYVMRDDSAAFLCGAAVYTLTQDLLTFLKLKSPLKMNFLGVSCSVSSRGIIGREVYYADMVKHILNNEKGMTVGLNLLKNIPELDCASGKTLPAVIFNNSFLTFDGYLGQLRSDYRRRYNKTTSCFKGIREEISGCEKFTREMYLRYLDVLKRSKGRLETLTFDFFANLPAQFELHSYHAGERLIGWVITVKDGRKLCFFLGGIDYSLNNRYAAYLNMLFKIIRTGIEGGYESIDLGQTAEIPKMRSGGALSERFMFGYHSNLLLNLALKAGKNMLVYGARLPQTHVFRDAQ